MTETRREEDEPRIPIADYDHPEQLPGTIRSAQFECPLSGAKEGHNQARIKQNPKQSEQQIVWAELRIT
jgi:hypothetical protein